MSEHDNNGKFLFGFFLGGLIGALVIFFLGTKEGKKLEKKLELKGKDVLDELDEKLEELEANGKELVKKGEAMKEQVMDTFEQKKEEMTDATVEKIDTALAHIEALQHKGAETTKNIRRNFTNLPKKK
jgi:gas vesicle protein